MLPARSAACSISKCDGCRQVSGICTANTPPLHFKRFVTMFVITSARLCAGIHSNDELAKITSYFRSVDDDDDNGGVVAATAVDDDLPT